MNRKSFEEIEQIIRNAADVNEPAFDEAAWKKMEQILDGRKRRPLVPFWIFSVLILVGLMIGGGMIYRNAVVDLAPDVSEMPFVSSNSSGEKMFEPGSEPARPVNTMSEQEQAINPVEENEQMNTGTVPESIGQSSSEILPNPKTNTSKQQSQLNKLPVSSENRSGYEILNPRKKKFNNAGRVRISITAPGIAYAEEMVPGVSLITVNSGMDASESPAGEKSEIGRMTKAADSIDSQPETISLTTLSPENKKKKSNVQGFYLLGAIGAETNSTAFMKFDGSPVTARYGFGIGYRISEKWSVQASVNSSAKKYTAAAEDYRIKPGSYLSYVKITGIDANCRVYEIPVSVQYNLVNRKRNRLFVSGGVSSYIMKNEDYDISYEHNNVTYRRGYYYKKNSHLAAAVTLSAGVEKQLSGKTFIQVAPVINIPLTGVGEGKVNLYTHGITFSLKYFPFKN